MIQKIYEGFEDSLYYVETNKKKLAYDNMNVISIMLTFFVIISLIFVSLLLAFGNGMITYVHYLPSVIILIGILLINRGISGKISTDFYRVRIYSVIIYTIIIYSFTHSDMIIYSSSRMVFFPAAVLAISSLYIDTLGFMTIYKIAISVPVILVDFLYKDKSIVVNDIIVIVLVIIVSNLCYSAVIRATLSRKDDSMELVQKSQTDLLTGLLNKVSFEEKCSEYLKNKLNGAKCALFFFDLDDFKYVNDNYGHATGDEVLKQFSEILTGYFHPDDVMGRIGGDEFMVLVLGEMPEKYSERRCRNVIHELRTTKFGELAGVTCSIGVVEETQKCSFTDLYKRADEALYTAKNSGKAIYYITGLSASDNS